MKLLIIILKYLNQNIDNMKTFKFLSKKQVPIPNRFALLNPLDRNVYTQGYYDAFDFHNHGGSLDSPHNPLIDEYKYEL